MVSEPTENSSLTLQWPAEEQVQLRSNEKPYDITTPSSRQFRVSDFFSEKNSKLQPNLDLSLSGKKKKTKPKCAKWSY